MPRENQIKLSGLWKNETKNGETYLSGSSNGKKYTIFKNTFKEKDTQPDYNLLVEPLEQNAPNPSAPDVNKLPF
tara:strand:+ start:201 stop:422 length:222 start_codon:yes stop_codon:yes gene_type:complete